MTEDLHLRQYPTANSADLLNGGTIPEGTTFAFQDLTACQKARNGYMWCPVFWPMNGYKTRGGSARTSSAQRAAERLACFLQPGSEQCRRRLATGPRPGRSERAAVQPFNELSVTADYERRAIVDAATEKPPMNGSDVAT